MWSLMEWNSWINRGCINSILQYSQIIFKVAAPTSRLPEVFTVPRLLQHLIWTVNKCPYSQRHGFSSSHVWMWELDHKESWAQKNWCFWTVVLEKTLESPLDCKEIQQVHPKVLGVYWKDWCWSWNSNTLATWCEELTHLKRPWCWKRLRAGGEGDDRGWDKT